MDNRNNLPPALQNLLRNPTVRGENGRFQARSAQAAQERREERRHRTLLETIKDGATVAVESAKQTGQNLPGGAAATAAGGVYGAAASELMQAVSWVKLDRFKRKPKPATSTTEATATVRNPSPASDSEERRPRGRPRNSSNPFAGLQGRARAIRRREIQADNASIRATRELQNLNESTDEATQADRTQHREIIDRLKGIIKAIRSLKPFGGMPRLGGLGGGRGRGRNGRNGRNTRRGANGGYGGGNDRDRARRRRDGRNNRNDEDEQRRRDDTQRRWDERRARRNGGNPPLPPAPPPVPPLPPGDGGRRGGGGSRFGRAAKGVGVVTAALAALNIYKIQTDDTLTQEEKNRETGAGVASATTGLGGAAAGAAIGTMIFPGVGTAIGGLIGGFAADYFMGDAAADVGRKIADWVGQAPLIDLPGRIVDTVGGWVNELKESAVGQTVIAKVSEWTQTLKDTEIGKYITENWGELTADISAKWDAFTNILSDTWKNLKEGTQKTLEGVNGWIKDKTGIDVGSGITAAGAAISNGAAAVGDAASSAWDATKGAAASAGDYVSGFRETDSKSPQPKITKLLSTEGDKTRVYLREDGSIEKRTGGFASWRNNNPGNLKFEHAGSADKTVKSKRTKEKALKDAQARYDGIVDLDQFGNAVFESVEAGRAAKVKLLTGMHGGKTIEEMLPHYAKDDYTGKANHAAYAKRIHEVAAQRGVDLHGKKIGNLNKAEIDALAAGMGNMEGWKEGDVKIKDASGNPLGAMAAVAKTVTGAVDLAKTGYDKGKAWADGALPESVKKLRIKDSDGKTKTLDSKGISSHADLQSKGGQAFQGGYNDPATLYATSLIQNGMGENFDRVTAQNDAYHNAKSPGSDHTKGTKTDFTVKGMTGKDADLKTAEIMAKLGLQKGVDFETINEYDKPSAKDTGGHIDFKLKEAGQAKIAQIMAMEKAATAKPVATTTTETNTGYYDYGQPTTASTTAVGRQESAIPAIAPVKTPDPLPQTAMQPPAKGTPAHPLEQFKQGAQQSPVIDTASIAKAVQSGMQSVLAGIKPQQSALDQSKGGFASHIPVDIDDAYWLRATNGSFT